MLAEHSALGSAGTMRGFQKGRPSVFDFQSDMSRIATPFLIMVGDEDEGAIEPSVMMKRQILTSGLMVFPEPAIPSISKSHGSSTRLWASSWQLPRRDAGICAIPDL